MKQPMPRWWAVVVLLAVGQLVVFALLAFGVAVSAADGVERMVRAERVASTQRLADLTAAHLASIDAAERDAIGPSGAAPIPVVGDAVIRITEIDGEIADTEFEDGNAGDADTVSASALVAGTSQRVTVTQPYDGAAARRPVVRRIVVLGSTAGAVLAILFTVVLGQVVRRAQRPIARDRDSLEVLVAERTGELLQSRSAVILGLAKLAESRDDQTGRHLERIRAYVRILGDQLVVMHPDVDADFVDTISETSALHDIGKVGIPDSVLLKPGALSPEQRGIIERHPLIGGDTLLAVKQRWGDDTFLVTACEIAFAHHERFDGSGYPFGLAGDVIPLSARIVALADVYDALTTKRVYKPAMSHDAARDVIIEGRGSHFDPIVVEAFLASDDRFREVQVMLSEPVG